eukprot:Partr_v1_DN24748_c1_g1_i4_m37310 putative Syntaxin
MPFQPTKSSVRRHSRVILKFLIPCVELNGELDKHIKRTNNLVNSIRNRLKSLERMDNPRLADHELRQTKFRALAKKFMDQLTNYQKVQVGVQKMQRRRMERQYRIVYPDATPQEIDNAINNNIGGQSAFASAVTADSSKARSVLKDVEDRHARIIQLTRSLEQLNQLFMDLQTLVEQQDESIDSIHAKSSQILHDTEAGRTQMTQAVISKRRSRRRCWYLSIALIVLLIAIAAFVYFQFFHSAVMASVAASK